MSRQELDTVLARRLPAGTAADRQALTKAYLSGVEAHALSRTVGSGPVPTTLATERAELVAHVSRSLGRLLTEDEVSALLRVTTSTARAVQRTMLAVYDDLPELALASAFSGASRDGRGTLGDIEDGYRVKFRTASKMEIALTEVDRRGFLHEVLESSGSRHVLLIDPTFPIDQALPGR